MPDEQVNIDINATDKASKPIDAVADKVADLDKAKVDIPVEADTKPAERDMAGLMAKVDGLARDPATLILTSNATTIARQITDLTGELDRLDANDPEVQVKSEQINSLQGDLDAIETKLREVNDIPIEPKVETAPAVQHVDELSDSAKKGRAALANMAGNAAQDLGALSGVAGSLGVGIGQLAEGFGDATLEGEGLASALGGLAGSAAVIGAIGLAVSAVTNKLEASKQTAKENEDQVTRFFGALRDGATILSTYIDDIEKTGQLKFPGLGDIVPQLAAVNLSVGQFNALAAGGTDKIQAWVDAQKPLFKEGSAGYKQLFDVANALVIAQDNGSKANERQAATTRVLGDEYASYDQMLADQETKILKSTAATEQKTRADQESADMIARVNQLLTDQAQALNDQVGAATSAADAQRDENKALEDYGKTLDDNKATTEEVVDSAISLAKAHQQTAAEQAKANGQTQTATANLDSLNDGLLQTASTAKGPARQGILDYIGSVNQIPPEKMTEIQAAIDRGDLETAKTLLDQASSPRTAAMQADADTAAANRDLNNTANPGGRPRTAQIQLQVINPNYGASLGVIGPGPRSMAPSGGDVVNVTQYLPRGWRGDSLAEVRRAARRSGGLYNQRRR